MNNENLYKLNGLLDEVRISKVARSASWIAAEYANQSNPSGFASSSAPISTKGGDAIMFSTVSTDPAQPNNRRGPSLMEEREARAILAQRRAYATKPQPTNRHGPER